MHPSNSPLRQGPPSRLAMQLVRRLANAEPSDTDHESAESDGVMDYTGGLDGVKIHKDTQLVRWLWITMASIAVSILAFRIFQLCNSHIRRIFSLTASKRQQSYWTFDKTRLWPRFKKSVLYAPMGKKRHNREIKFSEAVNVGTLPSRFHTLLLLLLFGSNIAYCCILDYNISEPGALIAEVRGRTGILATVNMVPLIIFAGRNNPLISLLRVSFDTYNLLHRWIGRIVVFEALAHTIAWACNHVQLKGWQETRDSLSGDPFLQYGMAGTVSMVIILIQSPSVVRHAFYETFLILHQALAFVAILAVYVHLESDKLPARPYIRAVVGLWVSDRLLRVFHLARLNISHRNGCTRVAVEALKGEACRVTFSLPRHVTVRPGSHVYAYLPSISWWMSHPFSVAWTNPESEPPTGATSLRPDTPASPSSLEKQIEAAPLDLTKSPTSISLIMSARTGMTRTLYDRACASESGTLHMRGFVEGPYAGHDSLKSYGTVILFAGGAGITHHLVQIRHLIDASRAGTVATRKIVLIWSVRTVETLSWVRPWMDEILQMEGRRDLLTIRLFVTKPKSPKDMMSPSSTVKLFPGRCKPGVTLDEVLPTRVGATAVSVCGPGTFADEVRAAVRERIFWGSLDFVEEAFTW